MHRITTFTGTLLLGSALLACPDVAAQAPAPDAATVETAEATATTATPPDVVQPTASVTLATPPAGAPAAPVPQPQPTATTLLVAEQPPGAATGAHPPGTITATTTIIDVPAAAVATPPDTTTSTTLVVPATATATAPVSTDPVIDPATYEKRTEYDNTPYRFNMEQNGERMTADAFTAWMEARGVRVARGPKPHAPANRTTDGMPPPGSARPAGVSTSERVTATATVVVPAEAAPAGALQPGSVTPTDAWEDPAPATTSSATVVVPVAETEPLPAAEGEAR